MKKQLILTSLFFSTVALAGIPSPKPLSIQKRMQVCSKIYDLAEKVMISRQNGVPINQALQPVYTQKNVDVQKLHQDIIIAAYKQPIQSQNKTEISKSFAEKYATTCLELASK